MQDPTARDDRPAWLRERREAAEPGAPDPGVPEAPRPGSEAGPGGPGPGGPRRAPATRLPTPYVTWAILAINTLMLIVIGVRSGGGIGFVDPNGAVLCQLGALNSTAIAEHHQWWRLLTVMVLHGGVIHFALNSWALWLFGPTLEYVLGRARFLALYVVSGLAGSAASFALGHTEIGVGASGAIFGLLGALVAFFWRRRNMGAGGQLRSLLLVLLINLIWGASQRGGIDLIAHVGGFVAGLLAMGLLEVAAPRGRAASSLALAVPAVLALLLVGYGVASFSGGLVDCANLPPGLP